MTMAEDGHDVVALSQLDQQDDRSMHLFELATAATAVLAAVLLALTR
jgi:hypothetical protein